MGCSTSRALTIFISAVEIAAMASHCFSAAASGAAKAGVAPAIMVVAIKPAVHRPDVNPTFANMENLPGLSISHGVTHVKLL